MNLVTEIKNLGETLLELYTKKKDVSIESLSALEKQVIFVYLFGMANGIRDEKYKECTPLEMETNMVVVLTMVFHHPIEQAQPFMDTVISCLQSFMPNTIKSIIHKGLDGYFLWKEDNEVAGDIIIEDIIDILEVCRNNDTV